MKTLKKLRENQEGSTLALVGPSLLMLLGVTAFAVDLGNGFVTGTRLQGTADAAAMAGATSLSDPTQVAGRAIQYAELNMPANQNGGAVLRPNDVELGIWDSDTETFTVDPSAPNAVRVTTRRSQANGNPLDTIFAGVLGISEINVNRSAIALGGGSGEIPCVLSLRPNGTGISLNSASSIETDGCSVYANSTSNSAITTNSGSSVTALDADICVAGDTSGSGFSPAPTTGCAQLPDPFAALEEPEEASESCDHDDKVVVEDRRTLNPGRYCKGLEINSGGVATLRSGVYVIEGDKFTVNSGSVLRSEHRLTDDPAPGAGVTIYLKGDDALLLINSDSELELVAPSTGPFAGVSIFVDRDAKRDNKHEINSNSGVNIDGAIYVPNSELMLNSDGNVGGPNVCSQYVAFELNLNSDSNLLVDGTACNPEESVAQSPFGDVLLVR